MRLKTIFNLVLTIFIVGVFIVSGFTIVNIFNIQQFEEIKGLLKIIVIPTLLVTIFVVFIFVFNAVRKEIKFKFSRNSKILYNSFYGLYNISNKNKLIADIKELKKKLNLNNYKEEKFAHKIFINFVEELKENKLEFDIEKVQKIYKELGFYKISLNDLAYETTYKKALAAYRIGLLELKKEFPEIKINNVSTNEFENSVTFSKILSTNNIETLFNSFNFKTNIFYNIEIKTKFFFLFDKFNVSTNEILNFLNSKNHNLIAFAIAYMSKKELKLKDEQIVNLLKRNDKIRSEVFVNLKISANNDKVLDQIHLLFETETLENKISILQIIEENKEFYNYTFLNNLNPNLYNPKLFYQIIKTKIKFKKHHNLNIKFNVNDLTIVEVIEKELYS